MENGSPINFSGLFIALSRILQSCVVESICGSLTRKRREVSLLSSTLLIIAETKLSMKINDLAFFTLPSGIAQQGKLANRLTRELMLPLPSGP